MSRSENSIKNIFSSIFMVFINIFLGFICQRIFVQRLGTINLGINGLFSNIISFLSIADLGIGTAIIFNMYKPIVDNDREKIKSLMKFYKKSYHIIAIIIFLIGFLISFFLPQIIGDNNISLIDSNINIYIIFYLYLIDSVFSYLLTYKRSILYASQKNYIINNYHTICIIIMYCFQILVLILFNDFYLYLFVKIICRLLENIFINLRVNKEYSYLTEKKIRKLDKNTSSDISKRVKASVFHNIGGYIVLSTDNILISSLIGIEVVGLYSNYVLILNAVNSLLAQLFNSIVASVGNLLVERNFNKINKLCDNFNYFNFWLYTVATCVLYGCVQPFVEIWLGKSYLLSKYAVIVICFNFFFQGMRHTMQVFAQAGGICYENRFIPLIEAILNIVFSVIFVHFFGLSGIFIGTIISTFAVHFYSYPKFIYKLLLNRKPSEYIIQFIKKIVLFSIIFMLCVFSIFYINISNLYYNLILNMFVCLIISISILYIIYNRCDSFFYLKSIIKRILNKFRRSSL